MGQSYDENVQHSLQRYMHRCSLNVKCNYLVHDSKTQEFKFYASEDQISEDEDSLAIWKRTSVLRG